MYNNSNYQMLNVVCCSRRSRRRDNDCFQQPKENLDIASSARVGIQLTGVALNISSAAELVFNFFVLIGPMVDIYQKSQNLPTL